MFHSKTNREPERYYLLPGMGGRAARRKQRFFLIWSAVAALGLSVILVALMYWLNHLNLL